jgi:hypothetical protein
MELLKELSVHLHDLEGKLSVDTIAKIFGRDPPLVMDLCHRVHQLVEILWRVRKERGKRNATPKQILSCLWSSWSEEVFIELVKLKALLVFAAAVASTAS